MSELLFSTYDPRYLNIILHKSRYVSHIQGRHFSVTIDSIRDTIEEPDLITQDVGSDFVENYYAQGVIESDPDSFLKVCVLFTGRSGIFCVTNKIQKP